MASLLYQQIEGLSKEKGIDPAIVVGAVEDAVAVATRKNLKTQENLRGVLDKESGAIEIFAVKTIVETPELVEDPNLQVSLDEARKQDAAAEVGGELKTHRASHSLSQPTGLGRISAQIAKQVIFQKVREAERDTVFAEYSGRINEVVTAMVKRIEGPDVIFEVGKIEVMSKDKDVDSVGACVGMKGMRVQSIIRELRGEKIDIIEYHEDAVTFAEKALQPAKVSRVTVVDAAEKHLEVIVDDSQLSLAIGKKGQNVRLAAKLLGRKIDIKSEEEKRQEVELQMSALVSPPSTPLDQVPDLGEGLVEKLGAAGVTTVEALADMTPEQWEAIQGIGPKTVEKISIAVNNYFASLEATQPAEEAAATEGEAAAEVTAAATEQPPDESASELAEDVATGQALEADAIAGVENAPPASEDEQAEVHTGTEAPEAGEESAEEKTEE